MCRCIQKVLVEEIYPYLCIVMQATPPAAAGTTNIPLFSAYNSLFLPLASLIPNFNCFTQKCPGWFSAAGGLRVGQGEPDSLSNNKTREEKVVLVPLQNPGELCFDTSFLLQAFRLGLQIRQTTAPLMGSDISLFPHKSHQTRQSEKPLQNLILHKYLTLPKTTAAEASADFRLFVGLTFSPFPAMTKSFTYCLCKGDGHSYLSRSCANTIITARESPGCTSIEHDRTVCVEVHNVALYPWAPGSAGSSKE